VEARVTEKAMTPVEEAHVRSVLANEPPVAMMSAQMGRKMLATIDKLRETIEQLRGNA
jgi:hypothetical protein